MKNRNLLHYIVIILVVTLLVGLYIVLVDPIQVSYCMDGIQENILSTKDQIYEIQQNILKCDDMLDSAEFTNEQESQISKHKLDLIDKRKSCMESLAKLRELENEYVNAKVVIANKK